MSRTRRIALLAQNGGDSSAVQICASGMQAAGTGQLMTSTPAQLIDHLCVALQIADPEDHCRCQEHPTSEGLKVILSGLQRNYDFSRSAVMAILLGRGLNRCSMVTKNNVMTLTRLHLINSQTLASKAQHAAAGASEDGTRQRGPYRMSCLCR